MSFISLSSVFIAVTLILSFHSFHSFQSNARLRPRLRRGIPASPEIPLSDESAREFLEDWYDGYEAFFASEITEEELYRDLNIHEDYMFVLDGNEDDFETNKNKVLTSKRLMSWFSFKCEYVGFENDPDFNEGNGKNVIYHKLNLVLDVETYFFGNQHFEFLEFEREKWFDNDGKLFKDIMISVVSQTPGILRAFMQYGSAVIFSTPL